MSLISVRIGCHSQDPKLMPRPHSSDRLFGVPERQDEKSAECRLQFALCELSCLSSPFQYKLIVTLSTTLPISCNNLDFG